MKMEKLNENQLKIDLLKEDLDDRDLKISEIFYGGDKVREFFHEMMEIAYEEHDFLVNNTPILVEALPLSKDEISLVITKVNEKDAVSDTLNYIQRDSGTIKDLMNKFSLLNNKIDEKIVKESKVKDVLKTKENLIIFSFDNIDIVANVSKRIDAKFKGISVLFKNNSKYFLLLEPNKNDKIDNQNELETILNEYGNKHVSTGESKFFLKEHGEIIIKKDAIKVLAKHL